MGKNVNIFIAFFTAIYGSVKGRQPYDYCMDGRRESAYVEGRFTNEAPVYSMARMLQEKGEKIDYIYGFSTNDERKENFEVQIEGEEGKRPTYKNQVEFFKIFLKECCPALEQTDFRFIDFEYPTEHLDKECADQAIRAAAQIKADMHEEGFDWSDCRLYVDATGGIRAADMVLSQIVQLLQHDGMKVEKILYSDYQREKDIPNRIFNIASLTSLSRLIAGADAFVRYGSSLALEEYFDYDYESDAGRMNADGSDLNDGDNLNYDYVSDAGQETELSEPLRKLLHAMHSYSDVMQICQVNEIKNVLVALKHALDEFSQHEIAEDSLKEKAFALMLDTIRNAYEDILRYAEDEEAALYYEMIRWCLKNGFTQQAMTLYVEWMPVYLEEKRVFYPTWREVMEEEMADRQDPSWQKNVFAICTKELYALKRQEYCLDRFKDALDSMKTEEKDPLKSLDREIFAKGREELRFLIENKENIEKMRKEKDKVQYLERLPRLKELYKMIQEYPPKKKAMVKDFAALLQCKAGWKETCNALQKMGDEGQCKLYGLGKALSKADLPKNNNSTLEIRVAEFEAMLDEGIVQTDFKRADVLDLVADYRTIRKTRNDINHAGNIKGATASMNRREVDGLIRRCLDRIENMGLGEQR